MKKSLWGLVFVLLISLFAVAEETEIDLYDEIGMNAVKEELDYVYEARQTEEGYFLYENEVLCAFYESGRLNAKARVFENVADIAPVANIPLDKLPSYKQGLTIEKVTSNFGAEGLEIMKINLADEDDAGVRRVLVWKAENDVIVQALFELDDNEWVLFAIAEVK